MVYDDCDLKRVCSSLIVFAELTSKNDASIDVFKKNSKEVGRGIRFHRGLAMSPLIQLLYLHVRGAVLNFMSRGIFAGLSQPAGI
ncbi:hypothetical protein Plhal304r1_c002g0008181 [Plasmopara halstedii]